MKQSKFVYSHFLAAHDSIEAAAVYDEILLDHLQFMRSQSRTVTIVLGEFPPLLSLLLYSEVLSSVYGDCVMPLSFHLVVFDEHGRR